MIWGEWMTIESPSNPMEKSPLNHHEKSPLNAHEMPIKNPHQKSHEIPMKNPHEKSSSSQQSQAPQAPQAPHLKAQLLALVFFGHRVQRNVDRWDISAWGNFRKKKWAKKKRVTKMGPKGSTSPCPLGFFQWKWWKDMESWWVNINYPNYRSVFSDKANMASHIAAFFCGWGRWAKFLHPVGQWFPRSLLVLQTGNLRVDDPYFIVIS